MTTTTPVHTTTTLVQTTPPPSAGGFCWNCAFKFGVSLGSLDDAATGMLIVFGTMLLCCAFVGITVCLCCYCAHKQKYADDKGA